MPSKPYLGMHDEVDVAAGGTDATLQTLAVVVVDDLALALFFGVAMSVPLLRSETQLTRDDALKCLMSCQPCRPVF
jgi:hypothetical protein